MTLAYIALASLAVMGSSLIGVIALWRNAYFFIEKNISYLVSFAAGVFVFTVISLTHEAREYGSLLHLVLSALAGFLLLSIIARLLPEFHHHHSESANHTHSKSSAYRILLSDGVHNLSDGVLITAAFLIGPLAGVAATVSIFIHELIQEISEFFLLKQYGYSNVQALSRNALVSSSILVGSIGSYFFFNSFTKSLPILLGLTAGGFIAVLVEDLLPKIVKGNKRAQHLLIFIVGGGTMFILKTVFNTH